VYTQTKGGCHGCRLIDDMGKPCSGEYFPLFDYTSKKYGALFLAENTEGGKKLQCLIDGDGREIVALSENNDVCYWAMDFGYYYYKENGKTGVKNFDGDTTINAQYDSLWCIDNGLFLAVKTLDGRKFEGIVTASGKTILPLEYENVRHIKNGRFYAYKKGVSVIIDIEHKG
jgi:hypothetical protein